MSLEFELFDLISLITILLGLAALYWRIVTRLQITELKVRNMEHDIMKAEDQHKTDIHYVHKKMNEKLDKIDGEIKKLIAMIYEMKSK